MFGMKVNEQITLKILEVHDTEALFNLVNRSRNSLREWLPFVICTNLIKKSNLIGFKHNLHIYYV
ncbi:hypothetical protein HGQ70_12615 [Staphylococcus aureus]|nr:hypothetical protein [Staphylococcus aureus]NMU96605.1 hypothetical protein [Staphylococcus aureus]